MQRPSDRWISIGLSLLLHAALVGALVWGWLLFRQPPRPAPTLAIEATVVDARTLKGTQQPVPQPPAAAPPVPQPQPQPEPEPEGPPPPTPEELARREQQRQEAQAAADRAQQEAEERAAQEEAAQAKQAEEQRRADEQRKAEQQRKADAKAAQERKAAEAALAQQKAAEAREASESEAELKRSLAAEEHASAARSGPALANWQAQIAAKIERAWLRPPTARAGIQCMLDVTQVPGGEVTQVSIGDCNGDQAVRESIEAAVYRASPLPPPPDPSLFDRHLKINFKPD
jgi:colicin import membrane protein